jgi:hypothetical protein
MLRVLGLRRWCQGQQQQAQERDIGVASLRLPEIKSSHKSAGDISKFTAETTSIDGDSRSVSSDESASNTSTDHSHAGDYGLFPSVYKTSGFHDRHDTAKSLVSVPTLFRDSCKVLSALREESQDTKWWNFDMNPISACDEAQEQQIDFDDAASDEGKDPVEEGFDAFDNAAVSKYAFTSQNDSFDFMVHPFDCYGRRKAHRSPRLTAVLEESDDEQDEGSTFPPRREKVEPVDHKQGLSRKQRPSSNGVLGACAQLVSVDDTMLPVVRSFQHLRFMTPEDFDTLEDATIKAKASSGRSDVAPITCSLSSMVHSFDAKHFKKRTPTKASTSIASVVSKRTTASASSESTEASSVLNIKRYAIMNNKSSRLESLRKRLSSAFRSKSGKKNVSYSLSKGMSGMSKEQCLYSAALLPSKPLLSKKERAMTSSVVPRPYPHHFDQPLSILLLNPVLKIFEIVLVDFFRDTTIGDALSKARAAASDDALAGQKYVSLCNRKLELAAPMLPVSLLVDTARDRPDRPLSSSEKRKLMEQRLLVAVPAGSSAKDCQHIRRVLWQNPRVQRWWNRSDPFSHPDESDADGDDDDDEALYNDLVVDLPQPVKPAAARSNRKLRHRDVRYQCLDDYEE